jgi:hypothetical protein
MRTAADHGFPVTVTVHVDRSRMRAVVRTVGLVVLGLGVTVLRLGLLPDDPDPADDPHDRSCPPHR